MNDYLIFRGGADYREWGGVTKEKEIEIWRSLIEFLDTNQLMLKRVEIANLHDMEGVELRSGSLNELGNAVIKCGFDKWLRGIDKGKSPSNLSALEKCLEKLRGKP